MQVLKVFSPSAASQQALFFLQGRQETKLCDHPLATLVHSLTVMQNSDQWFHSQTHCQCLKCGNIFFPHSWERSTVGAEKQGTERKSATGSGKTLGGKHKPWTAGSHSAKQGNPSFCLLCSMRGPPESLSVGGKASSYLRFSAATSGLSVHWAPLPTLTWHFTLTA